MEQGNREEIETGVWRQIVPDTQGHQHEVVVRRYAGLSGTLRMRLDSTTYQATVDGVALRSNYATEDEAFAATAQSIES